MSLDRIAQNILTLFILGGFGWIIYEHAKGNNVFDKFKTKFDKISGGVKKK